MLLLVIVLLFLFLFVVSFTYCGFIGTMLVLKPM